MILTAIAWTCWGFIYHWTEPSKESQELPAAAPSGIQGIPETVLTAQSAPATAPFWEVYGAANLET